MFPTLTLSATRQRREQVTAGLAVVLSLPNNLPRVVDGCRAFQLPSCRFLHRRVKVNQRLRVQVIPKGEPPRYGGVLNPSDNLPRIVQAVHHEIPAKPFQHCQLPILPHERLRGKVRVINIIRKADADNLFVVIDELRAGLRAVRQKA